MSLYHNKCMGCGVEWFSDESTILCPSCSIKEQNKEIGLTTITKKCTLAILIKDGKILLQKKAQGLFGAGKWNGAGGKFLPNETPVQCLTRELKEELLITVTKCHLSGLLDFYWLGVAGISIQVYIFTIDDYIGIPISSPEGEVEWFDLNKIPYTEMWGDDSHWLPKIINGKLVSGSFTFNSDNRLVNLNIYEVEHF